MFQNFKNKHFRKDFTLQWKIFYKFNHILHANKNLKMGKNFMKNILEYMNKYFISKQAEHKCLTTIKIKITLKLSHKF